MQDERIAAVERSLGFLGSYTELGGSFLARRFRQEAWPQLCRLLQRGPDTPLSHSEPLAPGVDTPCSACSRCLPAQVMLSMTIKVFSAPEPAAVPTAERL